MDNFKVIVSEFFKKHKLKIFIIIVIVIFLLLLNKFLSMYRSNQPITTKEPFALVMEPEKKIPAKLFIESESFITKFAKSCSEGKYEEAYEVLSEDCKNIVFGDVKEFIKYAKTNFPKDSRYEVIPYSRVGSTYIYQVKVFEDFLATGLTYSNYSYIDLKMAINEDKEGKKYLSVAGFMGRFDLDSVFENDYIKVEILEKTSFYNEETYNVKITNRTENDIVIKDNKNKADEILLNVGGDSRVDIALQSNLILKAFATRNVSLTFTKFFDEQSPGSSIVFSAIRVVKKGKALNYKNNDILARFSIATDIVR